MKIVCRCEDLTDEDIVNAIKKYDIRTLSELRQLLRLGMGPCQGRTCLPIAARILARETGQKIEDIAPPASRPPVVPVEIGVVGEDEE